jgi:hypothetical protein
MLLEKSAVIVISMDISIWGSHYLMVGVIVLIEFFYYLNDAVASFCLFFICMCLFCLNFSLILTL